MSAEPLAVPREEPPSMMTPREIVHELDPGMQKLLDEEEEIQRRLGGGDDHGPGKFHQE